MKRRNLRFPGFKLKAVTLSYDDGHVHDKRLIEIMQKYGLKGTFNVNSGMFSDVPNGKTRMTVDEARELYHSSGMEVAAHGRKHIFLTEVDNARATYEIIKDREELEKQFGGIIQGMAYAYGDFDSNVVEILKNCGIKYSRTVYATEDFFIPTDFLRLQPTCHHKNPKLFEILDKFLTMEDDSRYVSNPRLFYLWGHSYEFNRDNNWEVIEKFAKIIGERDDIWNATNMEIFNYVQAYDRLEYSIDGKTIYNPSGVDVYIYCNGNVIVPAGKTIVLD